MMGEKNKLLGWYFDTPLVWRILIALILGAITGFIVGPDIVIIEPLGTIMLRLLKMIILPLIFFAIVMGVGSTQASKIGRVAGKILAYYLITTMSAAIFGVALAHIFKPGLGLNLTGTEAAPKSHKLGTPSLSSLLLNIIPDNIAVSFVEGSYLQVLVFAIFFGLAISFLRDSKNDRTREAVMTVYRFCEGGAEIMFTITQAVLQYTPIGVFALIAEVFAQGGMQVIGSLGTLILACYTGYLFQIFVVYGVLLSVSKFNFRKFLSASKDAMLMAFATRSSSAVLPLSLRISEEKLGVSRSVSSFTLPLGSQINLDGEAYYQILSIFFVANVVGVHLSLAQQFLMVLVITIGSMGTAGIAGSGPVVLLAVMEMVGLKAEPGTAVGAAFALILGIDVILDMGRTCTNVTGDLAGTCIVAKSEKLIDYGGVNGINI